MLTADLLSDGRIKSNDTGEVFSTPSSWAIYCKKSINPAKTSGCGWGSVSSSSPPSPLPTHKTSTLLCVILMVMSNDRTVEVSCVADFA